MGMGMPLQCKLKFIISHSPVTQKYTPHNVRMSCYNKHILGNLCELFVIHLAFCYNQFDLYRQTFIHTKKKPTNKIYDFGFCHRKIN